MYFFLLMQICVFRYFNHKDLVTKAFSLIGSHVLRCVSFDEWWWARYRYWKWCKPFSSLLWPIVLKSTENIVWIILGGRWRRLLQRVRTVFSAGNLNHVIYVIVLVLHVHTLLVRSTNEPTIMPWRGKEEITLRIVLVDYETQFPLYRERKYYSCVKNIDLKKL